MKKFFFWKGIDVEDALEHKVSAETAKKIVEHMMEEHYGWVGRDYMSWPKNKFDKCPVCRADVGKLLAKCPSCGADLIEQYAKMVASAYVEE